MSGYPLTTDQHLWRAEFVDELLVTLKLYCIIVRTFPADYAVVLLENI